MIWEYSRSIAGMIGKPIRTWPDRIIVAGSLYLLDLIESQ
jgi:hypothetical protein